MKKILSILLSFCLLTGAFTVINPGIKAENYCGTKKTASSLKRGDTFYFGMYPQSLVTDSELISDLNKKNFTMKNYGYMQNAVAVYYTFGQINMVYADILHDGEAYRRVTINQYRAAYTNMGAPTATSGISYQENNGYIVGNTYYFKWEPIVWRVIAAEDDGLLVMSDMILDSQPYNNFVENVSWKNCTLRSWLNSAFYNWAFSEAEKEKIVETTHKNDNYKITEHIDSEDTTDCIWLLSRSDSLNPDYGFSDSYNEFDIARMARGDDYAKSQGLFVIYDGDKYVPFNSWWLRSRQLSIVKSAYAVDTYGAVDHALCDDITDTTVGVRPVLKINPQSELYLSDSASQRIEKDFPCKHTRKTIVDAVPPTCVTAGFTGNVYCLDCGKKILDGEKTNPTGVHTTGQIMADSYGHYHKCIVCGNKIGYKAHSYVWSITERPIVQEAGLKEEVCSVCNYKSGKSAVIVYIPHNPGDLNMDYRVNNKDLTRLFKYLSDCDVEINESAVDLNDDSFIDNKDLILLFQFLSGWNVTIN